MASKRDEQRAFKRLCSNIVGYVSIMHWKRRHDTRPVQFKETYDAYSDLYSVGSGEHDTPDKAVDTLIKMTLEKTAEKEVADAPAA